MLRNRFNIRSFGSNCSAGCTPQTATVRPSFQYPLFRIELLSGSTAHQLHRSAVVSISALSDRIAQRLVACVVLAMAFCFNIRSFGSNCSAPSAKLWNDARPLFQYPLFRIELLSTVAGNGRSVRRAVSISALSDRIAQRLFDLLRDKAVMFQYPLFRIELLSKPSAVNTVVYFVVSISALSDRIAQPTDACPHWRPISFQYPLFRIELLSSADSLPSVQFDKVSISALSDRIAQRWRYARRLASLTVSISALSDRIAQPMGAGWRASRRRCFNIRSFGSNCSAANCGDERSLQPFQYPLFRIELLSSH